MSPLPRRHAALLPRLLFAFAGATAAIQTAPQQLDAQQRIPASLTDQQFWDLTELVSETNGYFQSDNFLSNERGYQIVIPDLLRTAKQGGAYLGVGPEQNFPYIIALRPSVAIIFDIRRGNLHTHLLYKALFEMSNDRGEFLSRLFARRPAAPIAANATVPQLMAAFESVGPDEAYFQENLKAVLEWLTVRRGFKLHESDPAGIEYVYRTAFFSWGANLNYSIAGRGARGGGGGRAGGGTNNSSYAAIQSLDDGTGLNRGFLATEDNWRVIRDYHQRNLIVPVVGDFAGAKAIRAVGKYLTDHGTVVSAFYLSNVEQYLNQNGVEQVFLCNVATLPLDSASTFIYTGNGRYGGRGGSLNVTRLRPMAPDTVGC